MALLKYFKELAIIHRVILEGQNVSFEDFTTYFKENNLNYTFKNPFLGGSSDSTIEAFVVFRHSFWINCFLILVII